MKRAKKSLITSEHEISRLKDAIRNHWSIKNNFHHCLDVYFLQDASHKIAR
ncbi:MAG TPA: ISAs1 family transposase, partial [Porphyromonadaceae bacterium]|nr:ISAs1 family transposase [Porphyromonadaceae bacterium]